MIFAPPNQPESKVNLKSRYENYIGGEWSPPVKGMYFENPSPVTGQNYCEVSRSTAEDIDKALKQVDLLLESDEPPAKKIKTEQSDNDPENPPQRPGSKPGAKNDSFMMDFENDCLRQWDNSQAEFPKGPDRWKHPEWAKHIKTQVYPHHSDVDWHEYVAWVSADGGDEWFVE